LKDQRYKAIKSLIQTQGIQGLKEIFTILPLSVVKDDMKINYNTLRRRVDNGKLLTIKDVLLMAELFEVEPNDLFRLILFDVKTAVKSNRKRN
jgi:hypothetical protein